MFNFQSKADPEEYYAEFRLNIINHAELFFTSMEFKLRGVLTVKLCDMLFIYMQGKTVKKNDKVVLNQLQKKSMMGYNICLDMSSKKSSRRQTPLERKI